MPRKPRSKSPTGYFHITLRGNGGQLLFDDAEDRIAMLQILDAILPKHNIELIAWCLMGNHIHLLIDDPDDRVDFQSQRNSLNGPRVSAASATRE